MLCCCVCHLLREAPASVCLCPGLSFICRQRKRRRDGGMFSSGCDDSQCLQSQNWISFSVSPSLFLNSGLCILPHDLRLRRPLFFHLCLWIRKIETHMPYRLLGDRNSLSQKCNTCPAHGQRDCFFFCPCFPGSWI